jgi:hypothetical protein
MHLNPVPITEMSITAWSEYISDVLLSIARNLIVLGSHANLAEQRLTFIYSAK